MKFIHYILVFIVIFTNVNASVTRKETPNLFDIKEILSTQKGKGLFLFDADEVLFTSRVNEEDETVSLVRLYEDLEGILSDIRKKGHSVVIITYNYRATLEARLKAISLDISYFDHILSAEMTGDLYTTKGRILKDYLATSGKSYNFAMFIDNFPPFVRNIEQVCQELNLPVFSFIYTGYLSVYKRYVYTYLKNLQAEIQSGKDVGNRLSRIQKSLKRYNIDILEFKEAYPTYDAFLQRIEDLIWPYLTYL